MLLDVARGVIEVASGPEGSEVEFTVTMRVQAKGAAAADNRTDYERVFKRMAPRFKADARRVRMDVADMREVVFDWDASLQMVIDVRVTVPAGVPLEVRNVAAGVTLGKRHVGDVEIRSEAGSLFAETVDGGLIATTHSGSITVGEVTGRSELGSDTGLVLAGRLRGPADVRTSVGSVEIQQAFDVLKVRGDHADIILGVSTPVPEGMDLRTSAGSITLNIDENVAVTVDASTRLLGAVRARGLELMRRSGELGESSFSADLGGGGPVIKVRTGGANVSLVGRAPLDQ
ncbi:MAG: hypothetical protein H7067_06065 [Burkholderiales bacterium]|nr:hypothetical protein [Opitutaceae bacterium]